MALIFALLSPLLLLAVIGGLWRAGRAARRGWDTPADEEDPDFFTW